MLGASSHCILVAILAWINIVYTAPTHEQESATSSVQTLQSLESSSLSTTPLLTQDVIAILLSESSRVLLTLLDVSP